ncbi:sugar kinase [Curtobacterium ammoniigenes]|uniref:sugar kinase n=1 Tax=Curtobacterium ammoniigenes TaxID=395387 RepID=UPI001C3F1C4B|nr:sugar kinase [Curtobacterium ammoniigenes]
MGSAADPDVVTIGETMAMVVPSEGQPIRSAALFEVHAGGAESNVACHLARLGVRSAWVSALGTDALGDRVLTAIASRGVDVQWVRRDDRAPTGVYFKDPGDGVSYYRRGSAASLLCPDDLARVPLGTARVVHLSGITPALSDDCAALVAAVIDRVAPSATALSFDVNFRPGLWPATTAGPVLRALANRADIVFVGLDEAAALWGSQSAADVRAALPGPRYVVVKDGDVGATEFGPAGRVFVPAIPTDVVEAVGAGDAFAAGYLAAMLRTAALDDDLAAVRGSDPTQAGADAVQLAVERLQAGHVSAGLVLRSISDLDVPEPVNASDLDVPTPVNASELDVPTPVTHPTSTAPDLRSDS